MTRDTFMHIRHFLIHDRQPTSLTLSPVHIEIYAFGWDQSCKIHSMRFRDPKYGTTSHHTIVPRYSWGQSDRCGVSDLTPARDQNNARDSPENRGHRVKTVLQGTTGLQGIPWARLSTAGHPFGPVRGHFCAAVEAFMWSHFEDVFRPL